MTTMELDHKHSYQSRIFLYKVLPGLGQRFAIGLTIVVEWVSVFKTVI